MYTEEELEELFLRAQLIKETYNNRNGQTNKYIEEKIKLYTEYMDRPDLFNRLVSKLPYCFASGIIDNKSKLCADSRGCRQCCNGLMYERLMTCVNKKKVRRSLIDF